MGTWDEREQLGGASAADLSDIRASRAGDGPAYARLVNRYQNEIAKYMWRFTRDQGVCEELVHDTFVEAYLSLGGFRCDAPFLHWLRKIATRVGYRYWKTRARERARGTVSLDDGIEQATPPAGLEAAAEQVHGLLAQLPPRDRLVLTLLYLEGLSVQEAAAVAGWSVSMVKVQAFRARGKMKRLLVGPK